MQFNKWASIKNVAYSTVAEIVTEVFNSFEQGGNVAKSKIVKILLRNGMTMDDVKRIGEETEIEGPFRTARDVLENTKKRLEFISSEFSYVQPVTVRLNANNLLEPAETMHYIPITNSLKNLLEDETFLAQKLSD